MRHESGRECKLSLILRLKAMGVRVPHLLSCSLAASIGCHSPWTSFSPELRNIRDLPENNLFLCYVVPNRRMCICYID